MVQNTTILKVFILIITSIALSTIDCGSGYLFPLAIQQPAEKKEQPSFMQKIQKFIIENKQALTLISLLSIIVMFYPNRPPLFIEWALMNFITQMFGGRSYFAVHFNSITPYYVSPRPLWWS